MNLSRRLLTLCVSSALIACGSSTQEPSPDVLNEDEESERPKVSAAGVYEIPTKLELTPATLLPQGAYDQLGLVRELRTAPSKALFSALDEAGVPLISDLKSALPDSLSSRLEGWINDYVFEKKIGNTSLLAELDLVLNGASSVLTQVTLTSHLALPEADEAGACLATHTLKSAEFALPLGAGPLSLPLSELELPLAQVQAEALAQLATTNTGATELTLAEHWFGLPYGTLAYRAFDQALVQERGADFRGVLAELFDCPGLASSVAKRCVLGICVGHTKELREVCEQGLEEIVSRTQERFESMNFEAIRFESGNAELASADPQAKNITEREVRLLDGTWQASIDLGQGPRPVRARFDLALRIKQPE